KNSVSVAGYAKEGRLPKAKNAGEPPEQADTQGEKRPDKKERGIADVVRRSKSRIDKKDGDYDHEQNPKKRRIRQRLRAIERDPRPNSSARRIHRLGRQPADAC